MTTPDTDAKKSKKPKIDAYHITESLGYQTYRRDNRRPWTKEEDEALKKMVMELMEKKPKPLNGANSSNANALPELEPHEWEQISSLLQFSHRKGKDCRKRWYTSLNPSLKKGRWTLEEDEKLMKGFKLHGPSWQRVALMIEGRTEDQCAKRYSEVLDPSTKDRLRKWDKEEEIELVRKVKKYGTKWKSILNEMNGRPSLTCRNRWRKIITNIARGKLDPDIKREVQLVNGDREIDVKKLIEDDDSVPGPSAQPLNDPQFQSPRENTPLTALSKVLDTQLKSPSPSGATIQSPPGRLNLNMYNSTGNTTNNPNYRPGTSSPRPVQSKTDWKYSLSNALGEEIPNGFGPISSQDSAQRLIDLAKRHDLSITVHQHITHHYAPQQQTLLEPETQLSRYQHFKYLPPLTEVPKLTSSNSSPAGSSGGGSNGKESDLAKLLNNNTNGNGAGNAARASPKRSRFENPPYIASTTRTSNIDVYGTSREQIYPTNRPNLLKNRHNSSINHPKPMASKRVPLITEDLEKELDFWETMKTFTGQPQAQQGVKQAPSQSQQSQLQQPVSQPVSQHHPLHYPQENIHFNSNYHPSHQLQSSSSSVTPNYSFGFSALYGHNVEDDEEEEDEVQGPDQYDEEEAEDEDVDVDVVRRSVSTGNVGGNMNGASSIYYQNGIQYLNGNQGSRNDAGETNSATSGQDHGDEYEFPSFGYLPFNPS